MLWENMLDAQLLYWQQQLLDMAALQNAGKPLSGPFQGLALAIAPAGQTTSCMALS